MRLPWDRSKPSQLDLLATEQPFPFVESPSKAPMAHTVPPAREVPSAAIAEPSQLPTGEPLLVPLSALCEDPDNPRTEFPSAELQELAEDIRQHGILQPIVVQSADAEGRYRIHFGAKRFRAAGLAGLERVPVTVRPAAADPYAQVAENQKRHGLTPLDLARFIRGRIDAGDSNTFVARTLGVDLTTVAHHLALLDLPPVVDAAMKAGRCSSPRTLYELGRLHATQPERVAELVAGTDPITRGAVAEIRDAVVPAPAAPRVEMPQTARPGGPAQALSRATELCEKLDAALARLHRSGPDTLPADDVAALRERLAQLARRIDE
jgi:ParB family transcriptional regulator, chromosome partitioning protein